MKLLIIKHYGVKGMKWGVRKDSYYTPKGRKKTRASSSNRLIKGRNQSINNNSIRGNISSLLSRAFKTEREIDKELYKTNIKSLDDLPNKTEKYSSDQDAALVNPNYDEKKLETVNNSIFCNIAYEMRRRNYDVTANFSKFGNSFSDLFKSFKEGKENNKNITDLVSDRLKNKLEKLNRMEWDYSENVSPEKKKEYFNLQKEVKNDFLNEIKKEMLSYGNDSRGVFSFLSKSDNLSGSFFEIENNKITIRDTSTNKKYSFKDYMDSFDFNLEERNNSTKISNIDFNNFYIYRTDNLTLTQDSLNAVRRR